eukprot:Nk52_evm4s240 gene=Nk52_evmTU4s240
MIPTTMPRNPFNKSQPGGNGEPGNQGWAYIHQNHVININSTGEYKAFCNSQFNFTSYSQTYFTQGHPWTRKSGHLSLPCPKLDSLPYGTGPDTPRKDEAYVMFLSGENTWYEIQGSILFRNIFLLDRSRDFVILYLEDTVQMCNLITFFSFLGIPNVYLKQVSDIKIDHELTDKRKTDYHGYGKLFGKLNIFDLTEYQRLLYLDLDLVIINSLVSFDDTETEMIKVGSNFTDIWDICRKDVHYCGAMDWWIEPRRDRSKDPHPYANAGMLLIRPDAQVFSDLKSAIAHGRFVDGMWAEQDFLHFFFADSDLRTQVIRKGDAGYGVFNLQNPSQDQSITAEKNESSSSNLRGFTFSPVLIHGKAFWQKLPPAVRVIFGIQLKELTNFLRDVMIPVYFHNQDVLGSLVVPEKSRNTKWMKMALRDFVWALDYSIRKHNVVPIKYRIYTYDWPWRSFEYIGEANNFF